MNRCVEILSLSVLSMLFEYRLVYIFENFVWSYFSDAVKTLICARYLCPDSGSKEWKTEADPDNN